MSREILFRAKKVGVNHAGDWVEGNLIINPNGHFIANLNSIFCKTWWSQDVIGVNDFTVCQYTGLKDRAGKMIFENDIVKIAGYPDFYGWIRFGSYSDARGTADTNYGWFIDFITQNNGYYRQDFGYWVNKLTVIGNYFDNPELLEYADENAGQYADNPTLAPAT